MLYNTKKRVVSLVVAISLLTALLFSSAITVNVSAAPAGSETIFDFGSTGWSYKRNATENAVPSGGFEIDSAWTDNIKLPMGFGGGKIPDNLVTGTTIPGAGSTGNLLLQKNIDIGSVSQYSSFTVDARVDDGAVVFINGIEAALLNANTTGSSANFGYSHTKTVGDPFNNGEASVQNNVPVSKSLFVDGENTVTVLLINAGSGSSDIYCDISLSSAPSTPEGTSIAKGDEWFWLINGSGSAWLNEAYEPDAGWKKSAAPIGFGYPDVSVVPNCANVYLRRVLNISDISAVKSVIINLSLDDWAEVYFNGQSVGIYNEGKTIDKTPYSSGDITVSAAALHSGRNIISVNLINVTPTSSDIYFDMSLQTSNQIIPDNFVMTNGQDESEMGFAWYSEAQLQNSAVKIAEASEMIDGNFPLTAVTFSGTSVSAGSEFSNKVTVTGLDEDTEYAYCYGDSMLNSWSSLYTLKTHSTENGYQALFVADPQIGAGNTTTDGEGWNDNLNKAAQIAPDAAFILSGGDQVNGSGSEAEYKALLKAEQLRNLPFIPTYGNHDYYTDNFKNHYNLPNLTGLGETEGGSDYFLSYGNTLIIVINGNNENIAEHTQAMESALASHPTAKWRVVLIHQDVYGAGAHASEPESVTLSSVRLRKNLVPVFETLGIDIVLTGHDHSYARSHIMKNQMPQKSQTTQDDQFTYGSDSIVAPDGILYVTASCSSTAKFYDFVGNPDYVAKKFDVRQPQFTVLNVSDNSFNMKTYRSDTLELLDDVTVSKTYDVDTLQDLMRIASSKAKVRYSADSYSVLESAMSAAEAVLQEIDPSYNSIMDAYLSLNSALNGLEPNSTVTETVWKHTPTAPAQENDISYGMSGFTKSLESEAAGDFERYTMTNAGAANDFGGYENPYLGIKLWGDKGISALDITSYTNSLKFSVKLRQSGVSGQFHLYFSNDWDSHRVDIDLSSSTPVPQDGEWHEYIIDLSNLLWTGSNGAAERFGTVIISPRATWFENGQTVDIKDVHAIYSYENVPEEIRKGIWKHTPNAGDLSNAASVFSKALMTEPEGAFERYTMVNEGTMNGMWGSNPYCGARLWGNKGNYTSQNISAYTSSLTLSLKMRASSGNSVFNVYISNSTSTVQPNISLTTSSNKLPGDGEWHSLEVDLSAIDWGNNSSAATNFGYIFIAPNTADRGALYENGQTFDIKDVMLEYVYEDEEAVRITAGTTIEQFKAGMSSSKYLVFDSSDLIKTGERANLVLNNETIKTMSFIVPGDVNGDGIISALDLVAVKKHLLAIGTSLENEYLAAADYANDDTEIVIDLVDLVAMKKTLVN